MYRQLFLITSLILFCSTLQVRAQGSPDWQQRVNYDMDITLHADAHQITGTQWLTYHNSSPDTLGVIYYHLFFNAFQPNSMMAERNRHLPDPDPRVVPRIWNLTEDEIGYHHVHSLTQNGVRLAHEITDTILRVELNEPVLPGTSTTIKMRFRSQIPLQTRRSGRDNREGVDFSMSQWYPKVAAYDERGWHADPYVGREFYAPFGTFDVSIKAPADFVLGGTGVVQNPNEVGHGYQTDDAIKMSYGSGDSLTWEFKAEDVHDFAWVADTEYMHEMIHGEDGVTYHLLYLPDVEQGWSTMSEQVPQIIQSLSKHVGQYPYPQFTVAQAGDGGMEYPMVNFITGRRSPMSLLGVTAHEAAHEWFYGVLGSNESDYSWMDEGFTQYISARAVNDVLGRPAPSYSRSIQGIVTIQQLGLDERLNTPADWFTSNTGFSVASYSGGLMVAEMLGHVMSDDIRDVWLKEYFRRFKFKHPNPYDAEKVAEDVSGLRLDWFFEQLTNTTRRLDYSVESIKSFRRGENWASTIVLERDDEMVMPVDVKLTHQDGSESYATIPLGIMQGHKPVPDGWTIATPWKWTFPEYNLIIESASPVVAAEVDPFHRTPDFNRLNNKSSFPIRAQLFQPAEANANTYGIGYRPFIDYSETHGAGFGVTARGRYIMNNHLAEAMVKFWPEVIADPRGETFVDGIDWHFSYSRLIGIPADGLRIQGSVDKHLGIVENRAGITKTFDQILSSARYSKSISLTMGHQFRESNQGFNGVIDALPGRLWSSGNIVSAVVEFEAEGGLNSVRAAVEVGGPIDNPNDPSATIFGSRASIITVEGGVGKTNGMITGKISAAAEVGNNDVVFQKRRILGSAPLESQWRNPAARSLSSALYGRLDDIQFSPVSNRGPVAYLLGDYFGATPSGFGALTGNNLVSANASLSVAQGPASAELFAGIGQVWDFADQFETDRFLADAGIGVALDVAGIPQLSRWVSQSAVLSNLQLTALFPVWASDPQIIDPSENKFELRWLLGVKVKN